MTFMIRLRDNRFANYARPFRRQEEAGFYFAPQTDELDENIISRTPEDVWQILTKFSGKTLSELRQHSCGTLITLGGINESESQKLPFFKLLDPTFAPENALPDSFAIESSNLMGVLRFRHPENETSIQMEIHSRFDRDDRQLFLNYLLSRVLQVDFMDLISAGTDSFWDMLLAVMFLRRLKNAIPVGLYKEYKKFEENDLHFKGRLDLPRHLRQNYPLGDKIAYTYRAITFDNPINHLLRSAVEMIRRKWPQLLTSDPDTRDFIAELKSGTPTWSPQETRGLLRNPACRNSIRHPFFAAYFEELRILAKMLLEGEGLSVYDLSQEEVSGIVFDGAWLWEEYIAGLLQPLGFTHAQYLKEGKINIFDGSKNGMSQIYPDFLSREKRIVLDTKYKVSRDGREDLYQLLSYAFITGAHCCGLIYPPQEKEVGDIDLGPVKIAQLYAPDNESIWWSFAFAPLSPAGVDVQEFTGFMRSQEKRFCEEYVQLMSRCADISKNLLEKLNDLRTENQPDGHSPATQER